MAQSSVNPILSQAERNAAGAEVNTPKTASQSVSSMPVSSKLKAVEEALATSTARTVSNIKSLEEGLGQTQIATDVIKASVGDITAATQIAAMAEGNANLQAQNATIAAFEVSGGSEAQVIMAATLKEDEERLATLLNEKRSIVSTEHTGIPLIDSAINQLRTGAVDLEINAAQAELNQTTRQITNTAAATESFARENALTRKTLNEGVLEANFKSIAAAGDIKAAEAEIRNIHSNATAMTALVSADSQLVGNLLAAWRLEGEAESRELAKERQVLQREQMKIQREKWKVQLPKAKIDLEKAERDLKESINLAPDRIAALEAQFAGVTKRHNDLVVTEDQLVSSVQVAQSMSTGPESVEDRETIVWGLKQPGATGERYRLLQSLGGTPDPVLGQSPYEAAESLNVIAPSGNFEETGGTRGLKAIGALQAEIYKDSKVSVPKDAATLKADFNKTAATLMETSAKNIQANDVTNPYLSPPMSVLETKAQVTDTLLYQKILAPMAMKETDPQRIMDAAVAGVRAKSISPEEAAFGIDQIFEAAAAHNNTFQGGFRRVGLPNQTTYNVKLQRPATTFEKLKIGGGIFATPLTTALTGVVKGPEALIANVAESLIKSDLLVDLMDAPSVQQAIVKLLSAEAPALEQKPEGGE